MADNSVEKICSKCKESKSREEFYSHPYTSDGLKSQCRSCHSGYRAKVRRKERRVRGEIKPDTPEQRFIVKLRWRYKMSLADYENLVVAQEGVCKICGLPQKSPYKRLAVDHHHATGTVRGLLCNQCNTGLGMFQDNATYLQSAIQYLQGE